MLWPPFNTFVRGLFGEWALFREEGKNNYGKIVFFFVVRSMVHKIQRTYRPMGFVGVLICDIFSRKSSLNDRARLASLIPPRKLVLCKLMPTSQFPLCGDELFSEKRKKQK